MKNVVHFVRIIHCDTACGIALGLIIANHKDWTTQWRGVTCPFCLKHKK